MFLLALTGFIQGKFGCECQIEFVTIPAMTRTVAALVVTSTLTAVATIPLPPAFLI